MPVVDPVLTKLPAEQYDFAVDFTGEIEQPGVEVLYLNANGLDLGDGVLGGLEMRFKRGALTAHPGDVDEESAGKKYFAGQILHAALDGFGGLFAFDRAIEQRFEDGQQGLRLVQREGLHFEVVHGYSTKTSCLIFYSLIS